MIKNIFIYLLGLFGVLIHAQQNDFFREAKTEYDIRELEIRQEYERVLPHLSEFQKVKINEEYQFLKTRIDSARNVAYLEALIRTKVAQDLGLPTSSERIEVLKMPKKYSAEAEYLTGIDGFRQELMSNFYSESISVGQGKFSATARFVVEENGEIGKVKVSGDNLGFNKQVEIAIYLTEFRFSPAYMKGNPVQSYFTIPIKMNLD